MSLMIEGLACPWNIPNVYGETLLPGALAVPAGEQLPMLVSHRRPLVGLWSEFRVMPDGLFVRGVIWDQDTCKAVKSHKLNALSICYTPRLMSNSRVFRSLPVTFRSYQPSIKPITVGREDVKNFTEISLTDAPAYPNTWIRLVKEYLVKEC